MAADSNSEDVLFVNQGCSVLAQMAAAGQLRDDLKMVFEKLNREMKQHAVKFPSPEYLKMDPLVGTDGCACLVIQCHLTQVTRVKNGFVDVANTMDSAYHVMTWH
jgi:hypothetical protein